MSLPQSWFRRVLWVLPVLVMLLAYSLPATAAPISISWAASQNLSGTVEKSVFASIATDSAGKAHIAWMEYDASNTFSSIKYTNNVNGSFRVAHTVSSSGGTNATHITAIAVETNRVHIFYTTESKTMAHRLVTLNNGAPTNGPVTTLSPGSKGYAPSATVDSQGRVHAVWIDNRGDNTNYEVMHNIWTNGAWEGTARYVRDSNNTQQNFPSITASSDGRVHVVFKNGTAPSATVGYAFFQNGNWTNSSSPGTGSPNQQYIASDGTNLYAVWSTSEGLHNVYYSKTVNGVWQPRTLISDPAVFSDFPSITYSPSNGKFYAFWSYNIDSARTDVGVREISSDGTLSDITRIGTAPSIWPRAASSSGMIYAVWQDKTGGKEEVRITSAATGAPVATPTNTVPPATATATPNPIPLGGMVINGGASYTNNTTVSVQILNNGGTATDYTLSANGLISGGNYTPNGTAGMIVDKNIGSVVQCQQVSITGQLSGPGGVSPFFSASIGYDASISANVTAINPDLASNTRPITTGSIPQAVNPRNYGDPGYTSDTRGFLVYIDALGDECSGLKDYIVGGANETAIPGSGDSRWKAYPAGYALMASMPANQAQGQLYQFKVFLRDNAGNVAAKDASITYDATPPGATLSSGGTTLTTTVTTAVSDVVRLDTSVLNVSDNAYPNGYWGVWVMVNTDPTGTTSSSDWTTYGVINAGRLGASFDWNLAFGSDYLNLQPNQDYYVHIRFIDGAGNPSGEVVHSAAVRPSEFSSAQMVFMPLATR